MSCYTHLSYIAYLKINNAISEAQLVYLKLLGYTYIYFNVYNPKILTISDNSYKTDKGTQIFRIYRGE